MGYYGWRPYVPVAVRRLQAKRELARLSKQGLDVQPVEIEGRKIAHSFWGQAWSAHFEALGDFANRLPRGRTYVRNGSVCHLAIERGHVSARVAGSELYEVDVEIALLPAKKWNGVKSRCGGRIGSLLELLQGRLSDAVMQVVTDPRDGLFPLPGEIELRCSCPDWAVMCKHVAAVLYGVAARLDHQPDQLFLLRGVDHQELIAASADEAVGRATRGGSRRRLDAGQLADVFGIDLDGAAEDCARQDDPAQEAAPRGRTPSKQKKRATAKKGAAAKSRKQPAKKSVRPKTAVKKRGAKKSTPEAAAKKKVPKKTPKKAVKKTAAKKQARGAGPMARKVSRKPQA